MIKFTDERLNELKGNFKDKKVGVIGDMMLDCYFWGSVSRISPEAPVPVVEVDKEFSRFGGAANVAYNISTLTGTPNSIGVIGYDSYGAEFKSLLNEASLCSKGIITTDKRPTTAKTRVIAENQHVVRIDKENKEYIDSETEEKLLQYVKEHVAEMDAIILEDYNKGILTPKLIKETIRMANEHNIIVTVDPKFNNFTEYKNVTVFKPNRKEAEDALGIKIKTEEDVHKAGNLLLEKLNAKYILLTLGEQGITLFEKGKEPLSIPTKARKVADVSGAGDTVISTLTMALTAGANIGEAATLANWAGGLVCEVAGIIPIEINYLFDTIRKNNG